jgi:D-3-phosphoglycerate dehydrogenase
MVRRFRRCKTIMRYGVGTDNIDVEAATQAGMIVGHVPDYSVDEVSTHAIALLLACVRNVVATHEKVSAGGWETHRLTPLWRMAGRTLGLVGLGKIGQAVARKMEGWGLRLLATDPFVEPGRAEAAGVELVDSQTLWREADYVSLHVPLLPETRHLADSRAGFDEAKRHIGEHVARPCAGHAGSIGRSGQWANPAGGIGRLRVRAA